MRLAPRNFVTPMQDSDNTRKVSPGSGFCTLIKGGRGWRETFEKFGVIIGDVFARKWNCREL